MTSHPKPAHGHGDEERHRHKAGNEHTTTAAPDRFITNLVVQPRFVILVHMKILTHKIHDR